MSDMIEVFKDPSIMAAQLTVKMVNAHGQEEAGTDENRTITRLLEGILFICGLSSIICARAERGCK